MNGIKRAIDALTPISVIAGLLLVFHFLGENQRARDWWYVSGDPSGLDFVDLRDADNRRGHMLSTQMRANTPYGDEFSVQWSCNPPRVSWGEMWRLDSEMLQISRSPAPSDLSAWHTPAAAHERQLIRLACSGDVERARIGLHVSKSPMAITKRAVEGVTRGENPRDAFRAATSEN